MDKKSDKLGNINVNPKIEEINRRIEARKQIKINKVIIGIIILIIVILIFFIFSKISIKNQTNKLNAQLSEIAEIETINADYENFPVSSAGNYKKVIYAVKEFLVDYKAKLVEVNQSSEKYSELEKKILNPENLENDKLEFEKTKELIKESKEKAEKAFKELLLSTTEESIMKWIKKYSIPNEFQAMYKNFFFEESKFTQRLEKEKNSVEVLWNIMSEKYDILEKQVNFLVENKDGWRIEDGNIKFSDFNLEVKFSAIKANIKM